VTAATTVGWLAGSLVGSVMHREEAAEKKEAATR
jgi:hypothetical protein